MFGNDNSKKNQRAAETSYRFGAFELHPGERFLKRDGEPVPLTGKAFEALLCLVRNGAHLVRKDELMTALWPETFVSEANLTNIIVSLRKILGRDAIQTVSKHGYRFTLTVQSEPGITRETYATFVRAKELTLQRSLDAVTQARGLYWICLADDPGFATAWAWLGRCSWFLAKFSGNTGGEAALADAAFRRAFAIDPNLACAHQFYTPVEADTGMARQALVRLRQRTRNRPGEAESYAGLVQVLRFCGLLDESIEAHNRVHDLDPAMGTSVAHTMFLLGDYGATIESYGGRTGYYLDAASWAALGETGRTRTLLRGRLEQSSLSGWMAGLMKSLLAIVEQRNDEALREMEAVRIVHEPEALVYMARQYAFLGAGDQALRTLRQALECGFVCAPQTLRSDPWFNVLREHAGYKALLTEAESLVSEARRA